MYFLDFTCILIASWNYVIHHTKKQCCGSGFQIWIQAFDDQKLEKIHLNFFLNFLSKIEIYFFLGLPSYRRSLRPSKEDILHFKKQSLLFFSYFCRSFLPSWIRIQSKSATLLWSSCITFSAKRQKQGSKNFELGNIDHDDSRHESL